MISAPSSLALSLFVAAVCAACGSSGAPGSSALAGVSSSAGAGSGAPSGTVECESEPGVDTYAAGLTKVSENLALHFQLVSSEPAPPALKDNTFVVQVSGADGVLLAGELSAALDMPEHGHTSPKTPVINFDATTGSFSLDPMYFFMVGLWRITLTFEPALTAASGAAGASEGLGQSDSAVFQFCIE